MLPDGGFIIAHSKGDCNESTATFTVWCRFGNSFFAFAQKSASLRGFAADLAGIEFPQHTVGGQQVQRHRGHMLKAAGGLVPELRVMALQRELLAHLLQQLCDQARLIGMANYEAVDKGNLTARQNGYVGGYMTKKLVEMAEKQMAGK